MEAAAGPAAGSVHQEEEEVVQMTGGNGFEEAARGEGTEVPVGQDTVAAPEEVAEAVERFEEKYGDVFEALARGPVQAQDKEMTVRKLIDENKNDPRHRYIEFAVRDAATGRVLWDGTGKSILPETVGAMDVVSWREEQDPQDAEAVVIWIDVGRR